MGYLKYLVLRWVPVGLALPITVALCIFAPSVVLAGYSLNAFLLSWIGWVLGRLGEFFIAPALPTGMWLALQDMAAGIHSLYKGFVYSVHAGASTMPGAYGGQTEAIVRGYAAEGWLVVAEIAALIRYVLSRYLLGRSP